MPTQTNSAIKVGDKVSAIRYGVKKTGIVDTIGKSGTIVFVRFENAKQLTWMHLTSLTKEN